MRTNTDFCLPFPLLIIDYSHIEPPTCPHFRFTVQMYNNLGVTWAGTLNAFLLLALAPCPFLFYKYGARLRKKSRFSDAS